jgi:hypothetical protein
MSEQDIIRRLDDMEYQAVHRHQEVMAKLASIQANLTDQAGRAGLNVVLGELRDIKRTLST